MASSDFSYGTTSDFTHRLIPRFPRLWTSGRMRSPLFHCPLSQRSVPPTPRSSSGLHFQSLHPFRGLRLRLRGSALLCSPCGANMSTLQDSLYGTDRCFAPPSRRDTPLRHSQSPDCTGSLLRGSLAITTTGLAPVSEQCLSRHTRRSLSDVATNFSLSPLLRRCFLGCRLLSCRFLGCCLLRRRFLGCRLLGRCALLCCCLFGRRFLRWRLLGCPIAPAVCAHGNLRFLEFL